MGSASGAPGVEARGDPVADQPGRHSSARVDEGTLLWEPTTARAASSQLARFMGWLAADGRRFGGYPELWQWSVEHLEEFWGALWRYFSLGPEIPGHRIVVREAGGVEHARWFPDQHLNYLDAVLVHPDAYLALIAEGEDALRTELTYGQLRELAGSVAAGLRRLGVRAGDRVAAVLPNGIEAVAAFLGAASIGAVWSTCAPEFGLTSMIDRFAQIDPTVLIVADRYRYGGRGFDLVPKARALAAALPGLAAMVVTGQNPPALDALGWDEFTAEPAELEVRPVPFEHPLWILYSSGTTGPPKAIVHSHGGVVLEHLKALTLHCDLGPEDRFFWFSTTGWMMWNFLVGGLLVGATVVCFDGSPIWPDQGRLWALAEDLGITFFGTSAPYLDALRRSAYLPREHHRLGRIRTVGSTGAPLSPEGFAFAADQIADDVLVASMSGGTDLCTAFIGPCPLIPVRAGEIQCRMLGAKVEAFDERGRSLVGETGELVITQPMPSMPVRLWDDPDGARLHESYFSFFDGVWRHGDWLKITDSGGCVIYGRSDATLNRGGVRSGAADFYRIVDSVAGVVDSLVVDTSELGSQGRLFLFVAVDTAVNTGEATEELRRRIRDELSPRHVPDQVVVMDALPRTLNGKKLEVPTRRILLGAAPETVVTRGGVDDPSALDGLVDRLVSLRSTSTPP
jgi:acetoacetyl-CoA synthetase